MFIVQFLYICDKIEKVLFVDFAWWILGED